MMSRISIFNSAGIYITEIDANIRRTWTLSKENRAEFEMSIEDAKAAQEYLRFGNLIYIEHDYLPSWGGVIDPPREWGSNSIKITAYSAEHLLTFSHLDKTTKITASPGATISSLLQFSRIESNIIPRNISGAGEELKTEFHYDSLYDAMAEVCEISGFEYTIYPEILNGRLVFYLDAAPELGFYSNIKLLEGKNIALGSDPITEEGPIENVITAYGNASTWDNRKIVTVSDDASIAAYGIRYGTVNVDQNTVVDVTAAANERLKEYSTPRVVFDISIANADDTYRHIGLGNRYDIELYTCGFDDSQIGLSTSARIIGMTYEDNEAILYTVMEEYRE